MFARVKEDIKAVFDRDPAARGVLEVMFCYPGLHAVWFHRVTHWFWQHDFYFIARFLSHVGRFLTGIEIHPGARIGDNVTLYHGVTLGGVSWEKVKRHPTLEDNVVVGSGAKVLGPFTVHRGSKIGSNSVVVKEVPPNSTVVGIPGRIVMATEKPSERVDLEHGKLPDPEAKAISCLFDQIRELERKYAALAAEHETLKRRVEGRG